MRSGTTVAARWVVYHGLRHCSGAKRRQLALTGERYQAAHADKKWPIGVLPNSARVGADTAHENGACGVKPCRA